ncbi:hypothetical protein N7513_011040 [Penicillium frequentans]|uniref:Vacuolar import and degradation protein-domain-containing protein n=1 Tax=Penicillium frequentans TaxID=3151616 RepID=A0AAD6CZ56_9EURO|nr:hypothetical protein N7513_011040 [Penicillium glabrum]KAJ5545942.1 hypothetical protein N7494_003527 [Penicillium glabrum]
MPPPNSASHGTPALSPTTPAPDSSSHADDDWNFDTYITVESSNAHDENVNFLRSRSLLYNPLLPALSRHRQRRYPTSYSQPMEDEEDRMEVDDPNVHVPVEITHRIPIVRRPHGDTTSTNMPTYEGRRSNTRSLYGWAPGSDDEDEDIRRANESEDEQIQPFLHAISDRSTSSSRPRRREQTGRTPPTNAADREETPDRENPSRDPPLSTMEALLQSARRQPRLSRTRTLENYLLDRYSRANEESEEAERPAAGSSSSRAYRYRPTNRGESHRILTHSDLRARAAAHRQLYSGSPGDTLLKDTINYLDYLRYSNSVEESISSAHARGFLSPENFSSDFILDTNTIAPPAASSWLQPGVVFTGCQRAANAGCSVMSARIPSPNAPSDPVIVNGSDSNARITVSTTSGRRYQANPRDENWPVKVTIHHINYSEMTLSGTMEAYNIPDKTSPTQDAHIVTFLEGEIIDFNKHTLETKNFKADADTDSTYWRELQPFKDLSDADIAKNLVSRTWITEKLTQGWILMRWKERCFITPTDSRQGLTISGFYYISLCRENGQIEGLYYDPGSSPYQQLSLKPESAMMTRPSYSFR